MPLPNRTGRRRFSQLRRSSPALPDHVYHFDAWQNDAGAPGILETHHGFDETLDGTMVLFDNVVQVGFVRMGTSFGATDATMHFGRKSACRRWSAG